MKFKCPNCSEMTVSVKDKMSVSRLRPFICSSCGKKSAFSSKHILALMVLVIVPFMVIYWQSNESISLLWILPVALLSYPLVFLLPFKSLE